MCLARSRRWRPDNFSTHSILIKKRPSNGRSFFCAFIVRLSKSIHGFEEPLNNMGFFVFINFTSLYFLTRVYPQNPIRFGITSTPPHAFCKDFALYDFVRGLPAIHLEPRKALSAFWAAHIPLSVVFHNPRDDALHQAASPAFAVFVQPCFAFHTAD